MAGTVDPSSTAVGVAICHKRTVPNADAAIRVLLSGLKASEVANPGKALIFLF